MAITFKTNTIAARLETSHSAGAETFSLASGKSLKIEISPNGEELLNVEAPDGEDWVVTVEVIINKTVP